MTVIAALEHKTGCIIGCDRFLGSENYFDVEDAPKWFRRGPLLIALAGKLRGTQVAERLKKPRAQGRDESPTLYLHDVVGEELRKLHEAYNVKVKSDDVDGLIIYRGKLWTLYDDYGVGRSKYGYAAIGAGYLLGAAALAATEGLGLAPKERIERALKVAARHSGYVSEEHYILDVPA